MPKNISFTVFLKDTLSNEVCTSKELDVPMDVLVQYYNKDRIDEAATVRDWGDSMVMVVMKFPMFLEFLTAILCL